MKITTAASLQSQSSASLRVCATRLGFFILIAFSGRATAQPQMVRWNVEATVTKIVDPQGLFPNVRLGDPVHGMLKYDLTLFANPFWSGDYDRDYTNDQWVGVTKITIENPRDQSSIYFTPNVGGDFADVDVFNDYPGQKGDFDLVYASQSVVPPSDYQGTDAVWGVWLQGPPTNLPSFVEPWIDNHPPSSISLEDWPIATLDFWDGWFEDPTATNIEAEIYALTPVTAPIIPGDYNYDGVVDAEDYAGWRYEYGDHILLYADGNGDGSTDSADYVVWRKNLSQTTATASGTVGHANVPEPKSFFLLLAACLCLFRPRGVRWLDAANNAAGYCKVPFK